MHYNYSIKCGIAALAFDLQRDVGTVCLAVRGANVGDKIDNDPIVA